MRLQHIKSLLKPRCHAQTNVTTHCSFCLYIRWSWLMEMTDQNMDDENITRDFYNTYHLSAEQWFRAWCESENVHVWFLKHLYECESSGRSGRVALFTARFAHACVQPAPAQYAGQGSCVSNAGCVSDLCKESNEPVHKTVLNYLFN